MYQPPQFRADDPAAAADLMRAHPFASLISTDDTGFPFVLRSGYAAGSADERELGVWMDRPAIGGK